MARAPAGRLRALAEVLREALRPLYVAGIGVRIVSEFGWIIGTKPTS